MPIIPPKPSCTSASKPSLVGSTTGTSTAAKVRSGLPRVRQVSQPVSHPPATAREAPGLVRPSAQNHPNSGLTSAAASRPRAASTGIPAPKPAHSAFRRHHRSADDGSPFASPAIAIKPPSMQATLSKPTVSVRPALSRAAGISHVPALKSNRQRPSLPRRMPMSGGTRPGVFGSATPTSRPARPSVGPIQAAGRLPRPSGPSAARLSVAKAPEPSVLSCLPRPKTINPCVPSTSADYQTNAGTPTATPPLMPLTALDDHEDNLVRLAYDLDSPPSSPLSAYSTKSVASPFVYTSLCAPWADSPLADVTFDALYDDYAAGETLCPVATYGTHDLIEELDIMLDGAHLEPVDSSSSSDDDDEHEAPISAPTVEPLRLRRNANTAQSASTCSPPQALPARSLTMLLPSWIHADVYEAYSTLRHLERPYSEESFRDDESVFSDV